MSDAQSTFKNH